MKHAWFISTDDLPAEEDGETFGTRGTLARAYLQIMEKRRRR